jgi:hypothetical protein
MLRSAATLNRTQLHTRLNMKQPTTESKHATPPASAEAAARPPLPQIKPKLPATIRLFED